MTEATVGREPIQIVEILQPICENEFGVSPCTASGTADTKCYNTRATCQDTANFALGTPLSLFFAKGMVAEAGVSGADYIIPSLVSVSTSPTRINLASANPDAQGLGNRALCSITFQDHAHSDRVVDPYVDGRSWNPLDKSRGSFWTRWLVRNKYRQNIQIRVYEGYAGQALSAMTKRTYFLQSVQGPDSSGRVVMQGKDILARIEERKAQAPLASPGVLFAAITDSDTSFEVANAVEADYAASGTLRIGSEVMTYTSRATSTNGITFSGVTRGTDNTTAEAHEFNAGVQQCLRYTNEPLDSLLEDLITTYGGVDASFLDTAAWATEVGLYKSFYDLSALITEPTSVQQLVSEIQTQSLVYLWWDERLALVQLKAIRGIDEEPPIVTDESNILEGSFSLAEKPRERISQVWVYYQQVNPTQSATEPTNYFSQFVVADLESETEALYGERSIRRIFARWITSDALAQTTASAIITRYVEVPSECKFRMDAKDRSHWVGDTLEISHYLDVDQYGERRRRLWTIVSAEEVVPGEVVEYTAEDTTLYGTIAFIMADSAVDYPGAASAPFKNCYIGNADGLLSDGTASGRLT
jgi:hypothetical protein